MRVNLGTICQDAINFFLLGEGKSQGLLPMNVLMFAATLNFFLG